ncbi:MAG: DUF2207 domain-containing protein, partial [Deltaproteobacteria bacterium]|nr:DUF2207 domain-containing protein [Deltaproteobacteria bacterium]
MKRLLLILLVLLPRLVFAGGEERILSFDSLIQVKPAGDMTVTETITVVCEGNKIKHGIYRDFPTRYQDGSGNSLKVAFEVQAVLKDGLPEPWWTEDKSNGVRVYLGNKNLTLEPGEYTFVLTYRTDRQLGFFEKHDELYWNVTGNAWEFPIDEVTATVELPPGAEVLSTEAYTGLSGEKGTAFTAGRDQHGRAVFRTGRVLTPREGVTIVVMWPKGFVREPTRAEKAKAFFTDNRSTVAGAAGIVVLLLYYFFTWLKVGKDPEEGVIIPLYEAPKGFSPAAVRYVMRMGFDDKTFASALVNMAVKGFLTIDEDPSGDYTLTRKGQDYSGLSRDEARIAKQLFLNRNSLEIKTANHATLKKALTDHRKSLAVDHEKIYFLSNRGILIPGLVISVLALVIIVLLGRSLAQAGFMTLWLSIWTVGCALLVYRAFSLWKAALTGTSQKFLSFIMALFTSLFALPFLAGEGFGLWVFANATSIPAVLSIFTIVLLNILFYHLMKAPTIKGRQTMDQIEGLKLYLSVAEQDRLNQLHPPEEKTPEVFEKFLPYALALDVEQEWCERFAEVLAAARAENRYTNSWYTGNRFTSTGAAGLAASLTAMSSSISSSSSPPGSSSGGGGGGSSGGGGG